MGSPTPQGPCGEREECFGPCLLPMGHQERGRIMHLSDSPGLRRHSWVMEDDPWNVMAALAEIEGADRG